MVCTQLGIYTYFTLCAKIHTHTCTNRMSERKINIRRSYSCSCSDWNTERLADTGIHTAGDSVTTDSKRFTHTKKRYLDTHSNTATNSCRERSLKMQQRLADKYNMDTHTHTQRAQK